MYKVFKFSHITAIIVASPYPVCVPEFRRIGLLSTLVGYKIRTQHRKILAYT